MPRAKAAKDPLTGTWKTKNAISTRRVNVNIPTATYGNCLPARNSNLLMGVERKFAIEPVSFSSTTAMVAMITVIKINIITITVGTMELYNISEDFSKELWSSTRFALGPQKPTSTFNEYTP